MYLPSVYIASNPQKASGIPTLPEGHMRFLLPTGVDPSDPVWGSGERPARNAYVIHLISTRPYDDWRKFVAIHSPTIKSIITRAAWDDARRLLAPYLEIYEKYQVDVFSKGYRWNDQWRGKPCVVHVIHCPHFRRRIDRLRQDRIRQMGPVESQLYQDLLTLRCTIDDMDGFIATIPAKPGTKSEAHRIAVYEGSIYQIIDQQYDISPPSKNGRMYHSLTRTPKLVRKTLTIAGERSVEVDLANSQPYFMASIFTNVPNLRESVSAGSFYKDINSQLLSPWDLSDRNQKAEQKKLCIQCLYAKPSDRWKWRIPSESKLARIEKAIGDAFPSLPGLIEDYAQRHSDTALVNKLQKKESEVFIGKVLPTLQGRGIPTIPIHDSYLCRERDRDAVVECMTEKLMEQTGIMPMIR